MSQLNLEYKPAGNVQNMADELQKLKNQLCFSLYVCSKEIIRLYRPLLEPFGLTYTGYITMMALWETDNITVKELGEMLFLDSGTLTPLLKKLEALGYVKRERRPENERLVFITLTDSGRELKERSSNIPFALSKSSPNIAQKAKALIPMLNEVIKELNEG